MIATRLASGVARSLLRAVAQGNKAMTYDSRTIVCSASSGRAM